MQCPVMMLDGDDEAVAARATPGPGPGPGADGGGRRRRWAALFSDDPVHSGTSGGLR